MLVSNKDQTYEVSEEAVNTAFAQGFTTGKAGGAGFVLENIELGRFLWRSLTSQELTHVKGELWSSRSNGEPGSKIADLTPDASVGVDDSTRFAPFAAPAGTRLEGNTTYYFVTYTTRTLVDSDNDPAYNVRYTGSDAEDPETFSGGSIADVCRKVGNGNAVPTTASSWGRCAFEYAVMIRVNGSLATTAVDGNMTVGDGGSWKGFQATPSVGQLPGADFAYAGVRYRILALRLGDTGYLALHLNKAVDRKLALVLNVDGIQFRLADAVLSTGPGYEGIIAGWFYSNQGETAPSWTVGQSVPVSLGVPTPSTVKLSVSPNPVNGGSWVGVEACLSAVPQGSVRIPVMLRHGTSETGDWGHSMSGHTDGRLPIRTADSIVISGWQQHRCGVVSIPTHPDSDSDDETFTAALDTFSLPPGVMPGSPSRVRVTIVDEAKNARLRSIEMTGN